MVSLLDSGPTDILGLASGLEHKVAFILHEWSSTLIHDGAWPLPLLSNLQDVLIKISMEAMIGHS